MISPECRDVLEEANAYLKALSSDELSRSDLREVCRRVVSEVARFNGTLSGRCYMMTRGNFTNR